MKELYKTISCLLRGYVRLCNFLRPFKEPYKITEGLLKDYVRLCRALKKGYVRQNQVLYPRDGMNLFGKPENVPRRAKKLSEKLSWAPWGNPRHHQAASLAGCSDVKIGLRFTSKPARGWDTQDFGPPKGAPKAPKG